jgi:hypothetical protein
MGRLSFIAVATLVLIVGSTAKAEAPVAISDQGWTRRTVASVPPWLKACPELGTPATPARPRIIGRPSAAFRLVNGIGIATSRVFGAESSGPASLLCTLRTHRSPGAWQHSLPACLLHCDRAGLTPAGFHQEVSPSHLRILLFQDFPSAITMSAFWPRIVRFVNQRSHLAPLSCHRCG